MACAPTHSVHMTLELIEPDRAFKAGMKHIDPTRRLWNNLFAQRRRLVSAMLLLALYDYYGKFTSRLHLVSIYISPGYRGLLFACRALQNMQKDPSSELHVCFRRSYDAILKQHHTFIIRSVVTVRICFTTKSLLTLRFFLYFLGR